MSQPLLSFPKDAFWDVEGAESVIEVGHDHYILWSILFHGCDLFLHKLAVFNLDSPLKVVFATIHEFALGLNESYQSGSWQ